jgi:hypothetical protein
MMRESLAKCPTKNSSIMHASKSTLAKNAKKIDDAYA